MLTMSVNGDESNFHPVCVLHSTSPVAYTMTAIVRFDERCQQQDVRGHTVIRAMGAVPAAASNLTHAFESAPPDEYMSLRAPFVAALQG